MREPIPPEYFSHAIVLNMDTNAYERDAGGDILDFKEFENMVAPGRPRSLNLAADRGDGPIVSIIQYDFGVAAIRFTGGEPSTTTYFLHDGATEWVRVYVH